MLKWIKGYEGAYAFVWRYLNEESRTDESIKPTKV